MIGKAAQVGIFVEYYMYTYLAVGCPKDAVVG